MEENIIQSKEIQILESAEEEFFTKGYNGARTTSIAERAGVTHAMLHYYYRTKEQLFERILDKNMSHIATIMVAAISKTDLPFLERLKESITSHFDFVATNPLLPRFILNEIILQPERYEMMKNKLVTYSKEMFLNVQSEIDSLSHKGEIEWIDAKLLFMSIVSLNVFPFIVYPFAEVIMGNTMADKEIFIQQRKAENIETIMRRLKKI